MIDRSFSWHFAQTQEDAEVVRLLRNLGREWFCDSAHITPESQATWWEANKGSVLCVIVGDPPVGYGMLRVRDGRSWVSLAVDPDARGCGWGRAIYDLLGRLSTGPIYAAIRQDNAASRKAAECAGYVRVAIDPPGVDPACQIDWVVVHYAPTQETTP